MKEPKITYIRNKRGFPVACLAYSAEKPGIFRYGLSVYNPKDKFDKKIARKVALGRFEKGCVFRHGLLDNTSLKDILYAFMCDLADVTDCLEVPNRLRSAAKNYICRTHLINNDVESSEHMRIWKSLE